MTNVLLSLVRRGFGEAGVAALLTDAGSKRGPAYLEDLNNWISLDEACALLEAGVRATADEAFPRHVGQETLRQHAGTAVATLLRSLGSVEAVLAAVTQTASKLGTVTQLEALEVSPGRAVVRAAAREGFARRQVHCEWTCGLLESAPVLFGMPAAQVQESECQARGAAQCLYTVTWDAELAVAAADPQQRVTALEAQLSATRERLQSVYEVAGDLVSIEDVETVLQRIVERAADAVRAPSHILAVRPGPSAELQVYSRGIDDREAKALAAAALADEPSLSHSLLVVEVASSRHTYGQLIARYPSGIEFFSQDRDMLGLYAKHAAAVLDMALALEESDQRHRQVSSLLDLSHALAKAGTGIEVAERLAAAVPLVVDADRIGVWLWDELEQSVRPVATWGRDTDTASKLQGLRLTVDDTPHVRNMLTDPKPLFFDGSTEDPFLAQLLVALEVVALIAVPIVARRSFLGFLAVSVAERPERLQLDKDLMERLTGVAALAAPAMQNGQLVDQLRYKASHDGLTGLLNRVGFRQRIDAALASVAEDQGIALLFLDLDDFKSVNDIHGHDAGDQLIREAAKRLNAVCRGEDCVARLGGDEFAIIISGISEDGQLSAVQRRVRAAFTEPFVIDGVVIPLGASLGSGVWPDDGQTIKELMRGADAAMYADKARGRRAGQPA